ncbi:hypothetical protein BC826DRAFT_987794 [Russula brevipes]|nr:hypothetical protein BC826DRAFT_987794 [Russula brevipes]
MCTTTSTPMIPPSMPSMLTDPHFDPPLFFFHLSPSHSYIPSCLKVTVSHQPRHQRPTSRKGLNAREAASVSKKYKSHWKVGLPADIMASLATSDVSKCP